jgi:hypothetical protein
MIFVFFTGRTKRRERRTMQQDVLGAPKSR